MIPTEELNRLLTQATIEIEAFMKRKSGFEAHTDLAELFFSRADIHFAMKNYKAAMQDYETCMDYDPYFYEADTRMDKIMEIMLPFAMKEEK